MGTTMSPLFFLILIDTHPFFFCIIFQLICPLVYMYENAKWAMRGSPLMSPSSRLMIYGTPIGQLVAH